jgi:hypothetical protein
LTAIRVKAMLVLEKNPRLLAWGEKADLRLGKEVR